MILAWQKFRFSSLTRSKMHFSELWYFAIPKKQVLVRIFWKFWYESTRKKLNYHNLLRTKFKNIFKQFWTISYYLVISTCDMSHMIWLFLTRLTVYHAWGLESQSLRKYRIRCFRVPRQAVSYWKIYMQSKTYSV